MTKKSNQRVPLWAHPDFKRELKICSAESGKKMEQVTQDLAEMLRQKRTKKDSEGLRRGFL